MKIVVLSESLSLDYKHESTFDLHSADILYIIGDDKAVHIEDQSYLEATSRPEISYAYKRRQNLRRILCERHKTKALHGEHYDK